MIEIIPTHGKAFTMPTHARSEIREFAPMQPGNGSTRRWTRVIGGKHYSFTAVLMPDGERRYFVSRFNGYAGGMRFACAWDRAAAWTIKPATTPINVLTDVTIGTLCRFMRDQQYRDGAIAAYVGDCKRNGEANPIGPIELIEYARLVALPENSARTDLFATRGVYTSVRNRYRANFCRAGNRQWHRTFAAIHHYTEGEIFDLYL